MDRFQSRLSRLAHLLRHDDARDGGGVLVEHSHRLAAGTVVLLTLVLATVTTLSRDPAHRPLRRVAWLGVTLVFIQALLGGLTVKLRLPTPVSTAHTATSLLFFMTTLYLAVRSRPESRLPAAPVGPIPREVSLGVTIALVTAVCVYFQMCWAAWSATRAPASPAWTCRSARVRCGRTRTRRCWCRRSIGWAR